MTQHLPIQKTVLPLKRTTDAIRIFIYFCWVLSLPGTLFSQGINPIRVEHVLDIYGDFNQPTEVAVGVNESVYVLDGANNEIKIFTRNGKFVRSIGRSGKG